MPIKLYKSFCSYGKFSVFPLLESRTRLLYGSCGLFWLINGSVEMIVPLAGLIVSRTFIAVVFSDVLFSLVMTFDLNFNF